MENKIKHLEMIQSIIEKMSRNSFQLKGWTMTLIVATVTLSSKDSNRRYMLFSIVPAIGFWFLNAYYLMIERKYTELYDQVRQKPNDEIDFSMKTDHISEDRTKYMKCFFAKSNLLFYLTIIISLIVMLFILDIIQINILFCS